jgi:glycolate oxidase FAD binding subunit
MEVSGACYLPAEASTGSRTAFRLEGFIPSVEARLATLSQHLGTGGSLSVLGRDESVEFWRQVRDVEPFTVPAHAQRDVWRLSVPPAASADVVERIERAIPGVRSFMDWGGGLIWVQVPSSAHAQAIRAALGATGGHATLIRAAAQVRASTEVFHPQAKALAALSKRVKAQFDPSRVLNPGRMYADT